VSFSCGTLLDALLLLLLSAVLPTATSAAQAPTQIAPSRRILQAFERLARVLQSHTSLVPSMGAGSAEKATYEARRCGAETSARSQVRWRVLKNLVSA